MNIYMRLAYDGTHYNGWQRLNNTTKTIQERLETSLSVVTGCNLTVTASGRTDAGVHALGQVCNFKLPFEAELDELRRKLNTDLPEDISVLELKYVSERFHSRYNAVEKTYLYRIWLEQNKPLFERNYVLCYNDYIDVSRLNTAAQFFIGTYDFNGYATRSSEKNTVRTVKNILVTEEAGEARIYITADGFLYNMVRNIVGVMLGYSSGKISSEQIKASLVSRNKILSGYKLPAKGLFLFDVKYMIDGV